ncbi:MULTISPECIES: hypothetical protein [Streptomyces]|uniref:hypothetical protein n=1 Tax=Streptomyces TaxID=1883 RepID=UPI0004BD2E18|nr:MULTISPECIES: hypothetical protein [Streptomyces]
MRKRTALAAAALAATALLAGAGTAAACPGHDHGDRQGATAPGPRPADDSLADRMNAADRTGQEAPGRSTGAPVDAEEQGSPVDRLVAGMLKQARQPSDSRQATARPLHSTAMSTRPLISDRPAEPQDTAGPATGEVSPDAG